MQQISDLLQLTHTRTQTHEGARGPTPPASFLTATKPPRGRPPPRAGGRWRRRACGGRHKSPLPFSARGVLDARLGGRHLPLPSPLPGSVCTRTRRARRLSAVRHSPRVKTKPRPCLSKCEHVRGACVESPQQRHAARAQIQLFASPPPRFRSTEGSPACCQWVGGGRVTPPRSRRSCGARVPSERRRLRAESPAAVRACERGETRRSSARFRRSAGAAVSARVRACVLR